MAPVSGCRRVVGATGFCLVLVPEALLDLLAQVFLVEGRVPKMTLCSGDVGLEQGSLLGAPCASNSW